jgi:hypothetical protein
MARPAKPSHVVFMTRRFDEMVAWYRNVFGNLALLKPGGNGATAEVGVNHIALYLAATDWSCRWMRCQ